MRGGAFCVGAMAVVLATIGSSAIAAGYDIKAELMFYQSLSAYVVQIQNVGPVILGPTQGKFFLSIPAGTKVTSNHASALGLVAAQARGEARLDGPENSLFAPPGRDHLSPHGSSTADPATDDRHQIETEARDASARTL